MTPLEIALAIRNRADPDEELQAFVLRTMANEKITDLSSALELSIAWEHASDDFKRMVDILRPVGRKTPDAKIGALIAAKRKLGYDAELEAILARRWRCPHCKQFSTVDKVEIQINGGELFRCKVCHEEGIAPVATDARLEARDGGKSGLRPT